MNKSQERILTNLYGTTHGGCYYGGVLGMQVGTSSREYKAALGLEELGLLTVEVLDSHNGMVAMLRPNKIRYSLED